MYKKIIIFFTVFSFVFSPLAVLAQAEFNPNFIISDSEVQDSNCWSRNDIQQFLSARGSYLSNYSCADVSGTVKSAADIIYDAAQTYSINPKFLLVTLQKEQSLVTDDSPTQKQLDWATGYAVCDSCSMDDPAIQNHKGFGNQVDNAAGIIRWYYDNTDKSFVKKKDQLVYIDNTQVVPQSWATAFLYTYTPHLHGNKNFWRIWDTWFGQVYPNGSLLKSASTSEIWLLQDGVRRKFKNMSALITRADPKMAIIVPDIELNNYNIGSEISFPNYSLLKSPSGIYLLDYDILRPFESETLVNRMGYNPEEIIEVPDADLVGYIKGATITASTTAPQGVVYQIAELGNNYYLLKDNILRPVLDKRVIEINYGKLKVEKHKLKDLAGIEVQNNLLSFKDGTLIKIDEFNKIYVIENGKRRPIVDDETFYGLGYKKENVITVSLKNADIIPTGEPLYLNASLLSNREKYLGDSEGVVSDLCASTLPAYVIAEYPSGRIISGKNIDSVRPIASITKIMTAYEALNQGFKLTKTTTYSAKKYDSTGSPLKLTGGQKILNSDILAGALIASANNAARVLAQVNGLTESDFVAAINKRLSEWGADSTKISDPTGLSEKNVSTARDLLKIFTKTLKNDTIKSMLTKKTYQLKTVYETVKGKKKPLTISNTNLLFPQQNSYNILASKTGYTDEAGSTLIMLIENAKTKKQYLIVTLGNSNYAKRFEEPSRLSDWAIKNAPSTTVKITTN